MQSFGGFDGGGSCSALATIIQKPPIHAGIGRKSGFGQARTHTSFSPPQSEEAAPPINSFPGNIIRETISCSPRGTARRRNPQESAFFVATQKEGGKEREA